MQINNQINFGIYKPNPKDFDKAFGQLSTINRLALTKALESLEQETRGLFVKVSTHKKGAIPTSQDVIKVSISELSPSKMIGLSGKNVGKIMGFLVDLRFKLLNKLFKAPSKKPVTMTLQLPHIEEPKKDFKLSQQRDGVVIKKRAIEIVRNLARLMKKFNNQEV